MGAVNGPPPNIIKLFKYMNNNNIEDINVNLGDDWDNVKTNNNGLAIINVSIYKKGTYIVVTKFSGDGTFSSNSCTSKLVIK